MNLKKNNSKSFVIDKSGAKYTTLDFIEDLRIKISKLIPKEELSRGRLSYYKVSKILGQGTYFITHIKSRIINPNDPDYNPNYKFSKKLLESFSKHLEVRFKHKAKGCLNLIKKYKDKNHDLKDYSRQQYHIHNPNLKEDYFREINDKEKAYWFGFLGADGSIEGYRIIIELSVKDKAQLIRFCKDIGLDSDKKVKERDRTHEYRGEIRTYRMTYLKFKCRPMAQDLKRLDFASSKAERKDVPNFKDRKYLLAWLLGFYDGDGAQNRTLIYSANEKFLDRVKKVFKVRNDVYKVKDPEVIESLSLKFKFTKGMYALSLGPRLFNEMMFNFECSMERKRRFFSESSEALDILKEKVVNKERLQELVSQYRKYELVEIFETTDYILSKLIKEWNIHLPEKGFWRNELN